MDDANQLPYELPVELFGNAVICSCLQYFQPSLELEDGYIVQALELSHFPADPHA